MLFTSVHDGRIVTVSDSQPQDVGFESGVSQLVHEKGPMWVMCDNNAASIHSDSNKYLAIDRDSTYITRSV